MSDMSLERGYRRLLAWYPRSFRREHDDEMLAVLMAGARDGQRRPRLMEAADVLRSALLALSAVLAVAAAGLLMTVKCNRFFLLLLTVYIFPYLVVVAPTSVWAWMPYGGFAILPALYLPGLLVICATAIRAVRSRRARRVAAGRARRVAAGRARRVAAA
jgi:hypothetical protein